MRVGPHDAAVWILDAPVTLPKLRDALVRRTSLRTNGG
jgi:hypothetical protein